MNDTPLNELHSEVQKLVECAKKGDAAIPVTNVIMALFTTQLLALREAKAEYLDCKESPEQNWQNCTCPMAEAVPVSAIDNLVKELQG